jgi:hypothetical protein
VVSLVIFNGSLFPVKNVLGILGLTYASRDPRHNMSTLNSSSRGNYDIEILARALLCDFSWWNEEGIGFGEIYDGNILGFCGWKGMEKPLMMQRARRWSVYWQRVF